MWFNHFLKQIPFLPGNSLVVRKSGNVPEHLEPKVSLSTSSYPVLKGSFQLHPWNLLPQKHPDSCCWLSEEKGVEKQECQKKGRLLKTQGAFISLKARNF